MGTRYHYFRAPRPMLMVVSHERSGTHFLLNSLARGWGYAAEHWLDLDYLSVNANFHKPATFVRLLDRHRGHHLANPFKSHHEAAFMAPVIDTLLTRCRICYVVRHVAGVMRSLYHFLPRLPWREGPVCPSPAALLRTPPEGQMMRYQMTQQPTMGHRWRTHVAGWLDLADPRPGIVVVRYEDLRDRYAETLAAVGARLDLGPPRDTTPPPRGRNVILPTPESRDTPAYGPEDHAFITATAGDVLTRLGYGPGSEISA